MFKQKEYTGTCPEHTTATVAVKVPEMTNNINVNGVLTALYGRSLAGFLTECGCTEAKYDEENYYVWIHGVPYLFAVGNAVATTNVPYASVYIPFRSGVFYQGGFNSATTGTSQAFASFYFNMSTKEYKLRFRIVGDVNTAFSLVPFSYAKRSRTSTTASWTITSQINEPVATPGIQFAKGKDILRDNAARFINNGGNAAYCVELDGQRALIDIGYCTDALYFGDIVTLATREKDAGDVPGKLPLIKHRISFFEMEDIYLYPRNMGLPVGLADSSDTAVFITINGEKYWVAVTSNSEVKGLLGLVRCPTPD